MVSPLLKLCQKSPPSRDFIENLTKVKRINKVYEVKGTDKH